MKTVVCAIIIALCAMAVPVFAQQTIQGKELLICATVEAISCQRGETCTKGLAEDIGAPQFMRIDLGKKEIIGPVRTSPIRQMDMAEEQITLQGAELGMGWTIAIDRWTGTMAVTLVRIDTAFVVFGACLVQ
jgi:hypothetical protein